MGQKGSAKGSTKAFAAFASTRQRSGQPSAIGFDADKWGRLELDLGRWAQVAGIISAVILGAVLFLVNWTNLVGVIIGNFRQPDMEVWFPLFATSIGISAYTVVKKLGPFRRGFTSAHFLASVVALAVSTTFFAVSLLDQTFVIDLGWFLLWMYPASVLGLSLAFVSIAMTWEGLRPRKVASILSALLVTVILSYVPLSGASQDQIASILNPLFVYSAILIMFSCSMIHLTASAPDANQREILKGSDQKILQMRRDMAEKLDAMRYKEDAYVALEAELAVRQKELRSYEAEVEARGTELDAVQAKMDQQRAAMKENEVRIAKTRAEFDARIEALSLKEKDQGMARGQFEETVIQVSQQTAGFADREKEIKRITIDLTSRERALQAKARELSDLEVRLKKEGEGVDTRRDEVIRRENDLGLMENEIKSKIEELETQQAQDVREKMAQLRDWESKIQARERELGQHEVKVRQSVEDMKKRVVESDAYAEALETERHRLAAREQDLNAREKRLSDMDATTNETIAEIERRWREVREAHKRLEVREAEYTTLFKDAKLREAEFSGTEGEAARRQAALDAREQQITKWKKELEADTKAFNAKLRDLASREKILEQKENGVSLKELEMEKREREAARSAGRGIQEADGGKVFDLREKRLREREEEFQRRVYQKEKEVEAREASLREQMKEITASPGSGNVEPHADTSPDRAGRLRTGMPRLDDLIYGGFPMNANVLFVGPAFVGKEVAVLNFIAEGLRANVPAVIVTTSKPPVEIAKDMAPVLPTFLEYEQLGLVRWIDASGNTPTKKLVRDGRTFRVPSAGDFEGILNAVTSAENEFRDESAPYFRFAFLSLSSSLRESDEKTALNFVQRFVNRLRQGKCVAAFALERGMHTDQLVESLQQLMDGAIHFRQDKSKTMLSVVGIGEVQTREWVPYKFTNKTLLIGSFQLERIR
jgi:KaiC/GvpD/RAD55 family RecA-like ATPase